MTPEAVCQMLTHRTLQSLSRCCSNILQSVPVFWDASRGKRLWFPSKRTFKQTPRVPFKSGRVKVWLPRFAKSQKRCRGFISFLSAVCTRPGRQRRGEAVDQCDNIHGNTMTTDVWTWSRGSPMPFCFWMRRKPICGKIKWDDTASLADDWTTVGSWGNVKVQHSTHVQLYVLPAKHCSGSALNDELAATTKESNTDF